MLCAAGLFLALDDELHVHRQFDALPHVGLQRLDVGVDLALVVAGAAGVNHAVPDHRFEGRVVPQVQRINRLDIVVAVEQQGLAVGRISVWA